MNDNFEFGPRVAAFYPGLVTAKFYETWDFYTEQLGFHTIEESDDRVRLAHPSGARLAILRHETDEQNPELVSPTDGHGLWLQLDVTDVDGLYQRLRGADMQIVREPKAGARGSRFAVRDPNGVLVCVEPAREPLSLAPLEYIE
jgi:catechol 2,3-dioxygenase-like lactoylglutathione lyase family enzyme